MTTLILFVGLNGFGLFATLCIAAPEWDDEAEQPAAAIIDVIENA